MPNGTCALSQSDACRPARIKSYSPIFSIPTDKTIAVAKESSPSNASSWRSTSSSAPIDSGFFTTSMANDAPIDNAVMCAPTASLMRSAASTAFSSNPLRTGGVDCDSTTRLVSESILNADAGISGSTTCLTQTMMFNGAMTAPCGRCRPPCDSPAYPPSLLRECPSPLSPLQRPSRMLSRTSL